MKRIFTLIICLATIINSCGYGFYGRGATIRTDIVTVFVESWENFSNEGNIEVGIRNGLIDAIVAGGGARLVSDKNSADAVITGKVESVTIAPLSLTSANIATQARVTMVISASLSRRDDGTTIWETRQLAKSGDYSVASSNVGTDFMGAQKQEALTNLCRDVSALLYSLMFSGF
ncbi:MAG: hypothetical protein K9K75_00775 [Deltaproteobacteria bacterium]|nr:hypothetical protein [Deltaproteobacteria bacterium]